jgi:hypothetical protein
MQLPSLISCLVLGLHADTSTRTRLISSQTNTNSNPLDALSSSMIYQPKFDELSQRFKKNLMLSSKRKENIYH